MPVVCYETLRTQTQQAMTDLMRTLCGQEPDSDRIAETIDRNSFEKLSGRKSGEEQAGSAIRKGIVGDWRSAFTREARQLFDHYAGDMLIELGYEADHGWVEQCD